jgi:hypothetical protein
MKEKSVSFSGSAIEKNGSGIENSGIHGTQKLGNGIHNLGECNHFQSSKE